jgi:hypothetical protein
MMLSTCQSQCGAFEFVLTIDQIRKVISKENFGVAQNISSGVSWRYRRSSRCCQWPTGASESASIICRADNKLRGACLS